MAVDFYLLSSVETHLKRVNHEDRRYAFRDDDLNMFIYENSLLLGDYMYKIYMLPTYDVTIIPQSEIPKLLQAAENMLNNITNPKLKYQFIKYYITIDNVINFANGLIELCKKALEEEKNIIAIGD